MRALRAPAELFDNYQDLLLRERRLFRGDFFTLGTDTAVDVVETRTVEGYALARVRFPQGAGGGALLWVRADRLADLARGGITPVVAGAVVVAFVLWRWWR